MSKGAQHGENRSGFWVAIKRFSAVEIAGD